MKTRIIKQNIGKKGKILKSSHVLTEKKLKEAVKKMKYSIGEGFYDEKDAGDYWYAQTRFNSEIIRGLKYHLAIRNWIIVILIVINLLSWR